MARSIATAFSMPLIERRMRWETMMTKLRAGTIQQWFADFVDALQDAHVRTPETDKPVLDPPPVWPLRWAGSTGSRLQ
jgi:trehalose 6-phosphate synthase